MSEGLSALRENDLELILQDTQLLEGLWESSEGGKALYSELQKLASSNIDRATAINQQQNQLEELRSRAKDLKKAETEAFNEWKRTEKVMHQNLYPLSEAGVTEYLRMAADDAEARSRRIEMAIISGTDDIGAKVRDLKALRAQMLLKRRLLEG